MHKSKEKRIFETILSYVPNLIPDEVSAHKSFDPSRIMSLSGGLLQADASGFTKMSEKLSLMGPKGAEELTQIFNRFFSLMLKIVFANGGDVLKFGGDSLLVFFEGEKGGLKAVATALKMQEKMKYFRSVSTSCGTFSLTLHVGVNSGKFYAISLGNPGQKLELAILGKNVNLTIQCNESAQSGEVLLTKNCHRKLHNWVEATEGREEFFKLLDLGGKPKIFTKPAQRKGKFKDAKRLLQALVPYLPQGIYKKMEAEPYRSSVESEHRRVTVLFLNLAYPDKLLKNISAKKRESSLILNDYFKTVQEVVVDYGGVIARIDPYSIGDKVLVLFGAPVAQEDDEERAVLCALKIKEKLKSLGTHLSHIIEHRIGINTGNAFCGEVGSSARREYTVMGKDVNLSARLMSKADFGQILVGEKTFKAVSSKFKASKFKIKAKGISEPVTAFQIVDVIMPEHVSAKGTMSERKNPLIGREKEIAVINRIIAKVMSHQGQTLSIVGEPGIGKSRLTEKLLEMCTKNKMKGFLVDCQFYGSSTPLLPWMEIVKNYCGLVETDNASQKVRKLTDKLKEIDSNRWAPLFNDFLGLSVPENEWTRSLEGKTRRQILFDTVVNLILDRTKEAITYLILEDVHWIDRTSLDLLLYFSQKIPNYPILLVLVHRPELKAKDLGRRENHEKILLGELNKKDAFNLASSHLRNAQIPDQIAKLIWEKSRGNPLYLQELIFSLRDSGHLIWNEDNQRYELSCEVSQIEIPDTIQDVIMTRIDKLDEAGRKVIKTASAVGRIFSFDTLASILPYPLSKRKLKYWLEYLDKLDLMPLKDAEPNLQYMFKHALTQEVAYDLLPFAQKRNLHLKIGDYYEKKFEDSLEEKCELLAHHYENSPNLNKAFIYLIKAGNKGKRGYSNQEAIRFFDRAEEISKQDLMAKKQKRQIRQSSKLMLNLLERRGEVYQLIGEYSQAEKDFLAMLSLSKRTKKRTNQIKALNHLGELFWLRADYSASQAYVEQARRISLPLKDDLGLAMSFNNFGDIYRRQSSFEKALQFYQSSLKYFKRIKDSDGMARSYNNIGISYWSLGSLTEAAQYFEKALQVRRKTEDKVGEAKTLNNLALIYQDNGNLSLSLAMLINALKIFRRIGDKRNSGYCLGNMGTIYKSQAEFSNALKAFQDSIQIFSEIGDQHALIYSIGNIGDVQLKIGNLSEAKRRYDQTLKTAKKLGDEELESETLSRFGEYHLLSEDFEESEDYSRKALALAEKIKSKEFIMKALAGLTELQLKTAQYQGASKSSDRLLGMAQQENTSEYVALGYLLSGMAKASISPTHEAESDLKKALEISARVGIKEPVYKAHLQLGKLYHDLADIEGEKLVILAENQLIQARKILEEIASYIEEPDLQEVFLNSHFAQVYPSGQELYVKRS